MSPHVGQPDNTRAPRLAAAAAPGAQLHRAAGQHNGRWRARVQLAAARAYVAPARQPRGTAGGHQDNPSAPHPNPAARRTAPLTVAALVAWWSGRRV